MVTAAMSTTDILSQLETEIFDSAQNGEFVWAEISKKLIDIRKDELFRAAVDEKTGKAIKTWEAYVRRFSKRLRPRLSSGSVSTIKAWVTKFEVYDEQLGYDEKWLQDMGSHANILLRAANLSVKGRQLDEEDRALPNNGVKLGRRAFKGLCDRIYENVTNSSGPEDEWGVADTLDEVNKLLGSEPVVVKEWDVVVTPQNLVQIDNLRWIVGGYTYDFGAGKSLIPIDDFQKIAKGPHHRVSGLAN